MTASLRELNTQASALARRAQAGEVITITDRGRPIAELGPHRFGFRFADKAEVLGGFQRLVPIDHDRFRHDLDAAADATFRDPYDG